eukprot:480381_1
MYASLLLLITVLININNGFQKVGRIGLEQAFNNIHYDQVSLKAGPAMSFNVLDYGAVGDGTTDNTAHFKSAFSAAQSQGGAIVFAPTGRYLFNGQLIIPTGVSLIGSYLTVPSHQFPKSAPTDGTVLMPTYGKGQINESHAFIQITEDASLKGVVIYYPEQKCQNTIPLVYAPTIYMHGNNAAIMDVELLNSYVGIWAVAAHRHYIARVQGQPISIGVYVDETYDIGRIEDVHFNPWFCTDINYMKTQTTYGRSFVMGRSDWEYVFNTFSFAYAVAYHFIDTPTGSMNGNFLGIGADYSCNASILVDQSQAPGLLITNGEFTAFHNKDFAPDSTAIPAQLVVNKNNKGPVIMNGCSFWGPSNNIARLYGDSTTTFQGCQIVQWNRYNAKNDAAAVYMENGNLILDGNEFQQNGTQVECKTGVKKVIISNNIVDDGLYTKIPNGVKTAVNNNL